MTLLELFATKPEARVCISGSRDFKSLRKIKTALLCLPKTVTIVHGGARGVDREAGMCAQELGMKVEVHQADWNAHGKSAGYLRNRAMIVTCDCLIAFWDGTSRGTKHAIERAKELQLPTEVIPDGEA